MASIKQIARQAWFGYTWFGCAMLAIAELCVAETAPHWALDPALAGADLPPTGRSLFDRITGGGTDIPFPFARLVAQIDARAGCQQSPCTRQVLIPLGRSLQRMTAAPDFFRFPRVVVAAVAAHSKLDTQAIDIKDRLFIGYQEQGQIIEIISYNDAAARFEFQLVKNYAAGKQPELLYASRTVCVACHQNHAPIFSQQTWTETNANPRIAERLSAFGAERYGVVVQRGLKMPSDIDESVARANLFGVQQLLWREACGYGTEKASGNQCRASILRAALQYTLSGNRGFDAERQEFKAAAAEIHRNARRLWPAGIAIPDASLPNRDPLNVPASITGAALAHVAARFDPLQARAPIELWAADDRLSDRLITGIAHTLQTERSSIEAELQSHARHVETSQRYRAICELQTAATDTRFECRSNDIGGDGALALIGRYNLATNTGALESISVAGSPALHYFDLKGGEQQIFTIQDHGSSARLVNGKRMLHLRFARSGAAKPSVELEIVDDFALLDTALAVLAQNGKHYSTPSSLISALPAKFASRCCDDKSSLPPRVVANEVTASIAAAKALEPYCGACHATSESTPPNFLYGDSARVRGALQSCASRIAVRLEMWNVAPAERQKTPMPPALPALGNDANRVAPVSGEILASLKKTVMELAVDGGSEATGSPLGSPLDSLSALLARNYETLPLCLPNLQRTSAARTSTERRNHP